MMMDPVSPGPLKTRAASGLGNFDELLAAAEHRAPEHQEVDASMPARPRRFCARRSPSVEDEKGHLSHHRGRHWAFAYAPGSEESDEPIFRFDHHVFRQGEYVSITEHDGVQRTFRIASVQPARA
jgi:hypothetical protein